MDITQVIRDIVREEIGHFLSASSKEPELISVEQAAKLFQCDRSVILALHHDRDRNGFPSVALGRRTIKIDKHRLNRWAADGGLNGDDHQTGGR